MGWSLEDHGGSRGQGCSSYLNTLSFQLVSVGGQPRIKLTEDPEKQTLPGSKAAFRFLGPDGDFPLSFIYPSSGPPSFFDMFLASYIGSLLLDLLQLAEEPPPKAGQELRVWPRGTQEPCTVKPAQVEPLLRLYLQQGQVTAAALTCAFTSAAL